MPLEVGKVYSLLISVFHWIELQKVIVEELSTKIDIKMNRKKSKGHNSTVFSLDDIVCNLNPEDLQLALHILQNNILKAKFEICKLSFLI